MKIIIAILLSGAIVWLASPALALSIEETDAQRETRMKWWTEARFGMFIHWGLYALPARHEWVKQHEQLTDEAYQRYFQHLNPASLGMTVLLPIRKAPLFVPRLIF